MTLCPVSLTASIPSGKVVLAAGSLVQTRPGWFYAHTLWVCSGQGYLAQQFKAAMLIPRELRGRMLQERRWAVVAETLPDGLGCFLLHCVLR